MSCFGKSLMCETIIFYTVNKFTLYAKCEHNAANFTFAVLQLPIYILVSIYREIYINSKELVLNN